MAKVIIPWAVNNLGGRRNRVSSTDRLVNLVPEKSSSLLANSSDATLLTLVGAPGARLVASLQDDDTDVNKLYSVGNRLFAWSRKGMYEVFPDSSGSTRLFNRNMGRDITVADGVTYSDNGFRNNEFWFTDRGQAFIFDFERNQTKQIAENLFNVNSTAHIANIALFSANNSDQIQYSEIADFSNVQLLNFFTAESASDITRRIITLESDVIVFGANTVQVFRLTGDPDNPLAPVTNATHQIGCANGRTVSVLTRDVYWVSDDLKVYRSKAQSYSYVPVSLHQGVDADLHEFGAEDAYSYSTTHEGHSFYHLVIPKAKRTWVYDEATDLWHERSTINTKHINQCSDCNQKGYGNHIGTSGVMHKGKAYIGGKGAVYEYDLNYFRDDIHPIMREGTTQVMDFADDGYEVNRIELQFQNACKNPCDVENNSISIYGSDDQGKTYKKFGEKPLFKKDSGEVEFRRMGRSKRRSFRWRTFADEQVVFYRSIFNVSELPHGRR